MIGLELILAFSVAAFFALAELVTSKYPRTIELLWKRSWALWAYAVVYGAISLGFAAAYVPLAESGVLRFQTLEAAAPVDDSITGKGSPAQETAAVAKAQPSAAQQKKAKPKLTLLIAIMIGLSTKALLHIRLFSVPTAGTQQTFPVGTETIVQLFEPWLLRTILIDDFNAVSAYLDAKAARHSDLATVKQMIVGNLPVANGYPQAERAALIADVNNAPSVRLAMEFYLRAFGTKTLDKLFP